MTTFYIKTSGCSANQADSEQMAGLLIEAGFNLVNNIDEAYLVIFNTCTVKTLSENSFFKNLEQFEKDHPNKLIIIAGCIPQTEKTKLKKYPLIGTKQIHNIVEVVEEALNDNFIHLLENKEMPPLNLPRVRKNPVVEIIPISRGCLGACTFCKTKQARGNLVSYPIKEIVAEAARALKDGVKEIWLTSQDCFCYGFDLQTNIAELLNELVKLEGDFKIRVGMGNPDHLMKFKDELIEIYQHPKIFKFLHLPLQAGHNETLKNMRRCYTVQQFRDLVDGFREKIPELNLMTDIIVGFPGESDDHFWGTLQAVRRINPDSINISKFWSRPGTKAAEMKQLPSEVIKKRSAVITDIFHNISALQNERWLNWSGSVIIDEEGKDGQWIGRNFCYKQIILSGDFKLGDLVKVRIVKTEKFALLGDVL